MKNIINNTKSIGDIFENKVIFSEIHDILGKIIGGILLFFCITFFQNLPIQKYLNQIINIESLTTSNLIIVISVAGVLILFYIVGILGSLAFSTYVLTLNIIFIQLVKIPKVGKYFKKIYSYFWTNTIYDDLGVNTKYRETILKEIPKYLDTSMGYGDLLRLSRLILKTEKIFDKTAYYFTILKNIFMGSVLVVIKLFYLGDYFKLILVLVFLISAQHKIKKFQYALDLESIDNLFLKIRLEKMSKDLTK